MRKFLQSILLGLLLVGVAANIAIPQTNPGTSPLSLLKGGTQGSLSDPGADRIFFWDNSEKSGGFLTLGTNLSISGTTLNATGGGPGGPGDVVGPASATDNAIVRFDDVTGKLIQDSGVTIDDSNNMSLGTTPSLTTGTIQLGHASDTTLARVSAGVASIEGSNILTAATGQPLDADLTALALNAYAANATLASYIDFFEDTDNGANRVRLSGAQSTADVTVTLPAATDTLVGKATTDVLTNKTLDCGGTGNVCTVRIGSDVSGLGTGIATWLATPSSSNLASAITDETGSGALVFGTAPQISTIELGAASDTTLSRTGAGAIAVEGVGVALNSTSLTHTASTYEVGAATDTTLSRGSAGHLAVEGATVWDSGNDGSGSTLDADLLDGISSGSFVQGTRLLTGGTGIAAIGDLSADRTITLDLTELSTATFGAGAFTSLVFDAGATDPTFTFASNSTTVSNSAVFSLGTSAALTTGTIELGNASDTTLARSGAGAVTVEGVGVALNSTSLTHTASTIELGAASDTTISRTGAGAIAVEGVGVALNSTSLAHTASTYEIGAASDTTLARVSAGVASIEGSNILTAATGQPLDADLTALALNAYAANATLASYIDFFEDTDNGANRVRLSGAQSTADVTVTLPAATDTLVGKATTDVLTNKTLDCGGTGNVCTVRIANDVSGLGTGIATWLGTPSSANLATAVTDETGSGALVFGTAPQISTIELGAASDTTLSRTGAGAIAVEGVGVALNSTSLTHTASTYEIGAASDTTLARVSAGVASIEGSNILTAATGQPLDADLTALAGNVYAANASQASYIDFFEDTDNGANRVRLSGAQSTADVTVTLPAAADTLVGKATTDVLTNKTLDCGGTGNVCTVRIANDVSGLGTGVATFLGTPSSANLASAVTDETGSGSLVFGTAPQISTIELGAASDTTLSRTGAGAIAVEGVDVALNSTSLTHTASTYEIGAASDTTLARVSAGVASIEGSNILTAATGQPLDADLTTLASQFATASASGPASLALHEDTDNGSNKVTITTASSITADRTFTLPDADSNPIQPLTCTGSDKVSAISSAGVVTCSPDAGAGGGISNVVEDLTPQLGGDLDPNTFGVSASWNPASNDGAALGSTTKQWSDLFLAEGGVINWDNGDATLTQTGNDVTFAGITSFGLGTSTAVTLGTIELGAASDTTLSRTGAGAIAVEGVDVALNSTSLTHTASTIELGNASDTTLARNAAGEAQVEGKRLLNTGDIGKETIGIPASAMYTETTTGCASGSTELGNGIMQKTFDCDGAGSLQEGVQFMFPAPKSWDEGTLTARVDWTAASGSGDVIWLVSCAAVSNDDPMNASFGTEVSITDTLTAANDYDQSPESSAITCGGSPAENDAVFFRVQRDGDNASDTLNSVDAKIVDVRILYNTNSTKDD